MKLEDVSPAATARELGERLKHARLNADKTQVEVAAAAGVSRRSVLNAEKGKATLEVFIAIMGALQLTAQLENFLPAQEVSPVQLAKLQGKRRRRASGTRTRSGPEPEEW